MTGSAAVPQLELHEPAHDDTPSSALAAAVERARLLGRRRLGWVEHLRDGAMGQAGVIGPRDLKLALDDIDNAHDEVAFRRSQPALREIDGRIQALERFLDDDTRSPLARLCKTFELEPGERDVLQITVATALEPTLGKVWAALQHHPSHSYPSEALIGKLVSDARAPLIPRSGTLVRWELVSIGDANPGDPAPLQPDPHVLEFLCGQSSIDPLLVDAVSLIPSQQPPASWPVDETCDRISRVLHEGYGARVIVTGSRGSGRRTFAACVSEALGGRALGLDTTGIDEEAWPRLHLHAHRQALLLGSSVVWWGAHVARRYPPGPGLARLQFVVGDGDLNPSALPGVIDFRVEMPRLDLDERASLWRRLVPVTQSWPADEFAHVVERYQVQIGDIAEVSRRGMDRAVSVRAACRSLTRDRLGDLGTLLDCPFARQDLLVSAGLDQLLDEFLFEARERVRFWEKPEARRLFPRGTGLIALMTGPPGTGKTMAAQVIARDLDLDLFRIDLASSVSKYIGETAKNLRSIFARAKEMNAVLLFDEADALFSKRTEVKDSHDRYANADTNYLLQLLEDHDGIALLASNKRQNIDTAFVRRIRYILEFPRPTARERLSIWRRMVAELASPERAVALEAALKSIAETVEVSGAQIKLAVLAATFVARQAREPVARAHLLRGLERELGKEGRSLSPRERERVECDG